MLENVILLKIKLANPRKRVFEIKHSEDCAAAVPSSDQCEYGTITEKVVFYRWEDRVTGGVSYRNVEEDLRTLVS